MEIEIADQGAFSHALVLLESGESFVSESGAMFRASTSVDIDVTTRTRGSGGILSGLKRLLAAEHFFFSHYTAQGAAGEVGLAPTLQGEIRVVNVDRNQSWVCAGGSYLGSGPDTSVDTQFQGLRGMFSGESVFFMEVTGDGPLLVNAFGRMEELEVSDGLVVDTGHVVAFTSGLSYELSKAGGSWLQSWLAGEGIVLNFSGHGRVLVQSHNPNEYGSNLGVMLPARES